MINVKKDCTTMHLRAQLHRWYANSFKTIACYRPNGNYCGYCYETI